MFAKYSFAKFLPIFLGGQPVGAEIFLFILNEKGEGGGGKKKSGGKIN